MAAYDMAKMKFAQELADRAQQLPHNSAERDMLNQMIKQVYAEAMSPQLQYDPNLPPHYGTGPVAGALNKFRDQPLKPKQWTNEMPDLYDNLRNSLTPVGAIYLRMNMAPGSRLPFIDHISCHIVQATGNASAPQLPSKAIVFIVTSDGEDITLYDDHPHLFPSDNLILKLRMITDKS